MTRLNSRLHTHELASDDDVDAQKQSGVMKVADVVGPAPEPSSPESRVAESGKQRVSSWTIIDQYEHDGYLYRLSRRPLDPSGGLRLARREREALAYASEGYSNRQIASAMGLAPSTVGVLLFRAATKLRVRSRSELLAAYANLKKDGE